ncbi:MAG: RNA 2'-phosphotransferase [Deltaproteobacteria bacterium]|nr:RNA 2'-phosphotransferase [Deltaproteobacteria bacterium]
MDEKTRTGLSKFLSLVLRHEPETIGIELDDQGWVEIESLLGQARAHGKDLSRATLDEVVETSPKRRFAISDDGTKIRASQGHSVDVQLGYQPTTPPERLFHGTVASSLDSIKAAGLTKMARHHVHLSPDLQTARAVGARRGKPVVLQVAAGRMHRAGHSFFLSANGVWLTDCVPPQYIDFPEG